MDKIDFNRIEKLYHYTNFNSFMKIMESHSLKFGKLPQMNDINERQKEIFTIYQEGNGEHSFFEEIEDALAKVRQISLTEDGPLPGFDIPAMWGHYADRGNGVCIVFDKQRLEGQIKKESFSSGSVKYIDQANPIAYNKDKYASVNNYFRKEQDTLFFTKTIDWSYEQEFRIINFADSHIDSFINISDCVVAVILFNNDNINITPLYTAITEIVNRHSLHNNNGLIIPVLVYSRTYLFGISLSKDGEEWYTGMQIEGIDANTF